jgi:hypothetical protein
LALFFSFFEKKKNSDDEGCERSRELLRSSLEGGGFLSSPRGRFLFDFDVEGLRRVAGREIEGGKGVVGGRRRCPAAWREPMMKMMMMIRSRAERRRSLSLSVEGRSFAAIENKRERELLFCFSHSTRLSLLAGFSPLSPPWPVREIGPRCVLFPP